jgi:hypothetical protein
MVLRKTAMGKGKLVWDGARGVGYYPVLLDGQYGAEYWQEYVKRMATPIGTALNEARTALVEKYVPGEPAVDIGIGAGHFILTRKQGVTYGYDVNPIAIRWILDRNLWWDPYFTDPLNATCWDSLEHMTRPDRFVERIKRYLFISLPLFKGVDHILASRHFKPREHYWYWTRDGLVRWMESLRFALIEENQMETNLGREDIGTFVFRRRGLSGRAGDETPPKP